MINHNILKNIILTIILLSSLVLLGLALYISSINGRYGEGFYYFTIPFIIHVIFGVFLAIFVYNKKNSKNVLKISIFYSSYFITAVYAILQWPGGDDGPGLAWFYGVVGGSLITMFFGIIFIIYSIVLIKQKIR